MQLSEIIKEEGVEYMNCKRAAQITGVAEHKIRYYQRKGYIKSYQFGSKRYVAVKNGDIVPIVKVTE
jgi:predicted site-specific integrase-resolvase